MSISSVFPGALGALKPACADCRARGHYCPGTVSISNGEIWLCFACDAGEPCSHDKEPSKAARIDALAERAENGSTKASLKAARVLRTRTRKRDPEQAADSDLPDPIQPEAIEMRFFSRSAAQKERVAAINTVIRYLEAERSEIAGRMRDIDQVLEDLKKTCARWAAG